MPVPSSNLAKRLRLMFINDFPLERIGIAVVAVEDARSGLSFLDRTTALPGRVGTIPLAREFESTPKRIRVRAVQESSSLAQLRSDLDDLQLRAYAGEIEVRFTDDENRVHFCRTENVRVVTMDPAYPVVATGRRVRQTVEIMLLAQDPVAYDRNAVIVGFSTAEAETPLGNATSAATINIFGPSTGDGITIIMKNLAGDTKATFAFTGSTAVIQLTSTEFYSIDMEKSSVTRNGANILGLITFSTGSDFFSFDPQFGGGSTGPWPTLSHASTGVNAEAQYSKGYV